MTEIWVQVTVAFVLFLAYALFTSWLARVDKSHLPVLRFLDRVRRALAYEAGPDSRTKAGR